MTDAKNPLTSLYRASRRRLSSAFRTCLLSRPKLARRMLGLFKSNPLLYIYLAGQWKVLDGICLTMPDGPLQGMTLENMLLNEIYIVVDQTIEPTTTELVCRLDLSDSITIDVGASWGYYTMLLSRRVGTGGIVYAFEPGIPTFVRLLRNMELNNCGNVTALPYAISDRQAFSRWIQYGDMMPWYEHLATSTRQVSSDILEKQKDIPVLTTTLDMFISTLKQPERIKFVKIDVEGSEVDALNGARKLLSEVRPPISYEISAPENIEPTAAILAEYDYLWKTLDFIQEDYHNILVYPRERRAEYEVLLANIAKSN